MSAGPRVLCVVAAVALTSSCTPGPEDPGEVAGTLELREVPGALGGDFVTTSGGTPSREILEVKGGGVALFDQDQDGDLEVFVPNGATLASPSEGPGCRLFDNLGGLEFQDVTADRGLDFSGWGMGVAVGDVDGDGRDDLYVTTFGTNALLRNGKGGFEEPPGGGGAAAEGWSTAAAFGDLDLDGDLDLYVANYLDFDVDHPPERSSFKGAPVFRGPHGLPPAADFLYENVDGRFRDVTTASGCRDVDAAFGLGCAILDFNGDGFLDVFVGNDSTPNRLFAGRGDLTFGEVGLAAGLAANVDGSNQATMGIAVGDLNGDRRPDVYTTNFSNDTNTLHVQGPGGFYDDRTRAYGLGMSSFASVGWAAGLADFDQDGDEDLLVVNGHVYPNASPLSMDSSYLQRPLLYRRDGPLFTQLRPTQGWLARPACARGAAFGDLDADGDLDAVVLELNGPLRLLENVGAASGRGLVVELPASQLGARVDLRADDRQATRWVYSGGSFLSSNARAAHFGLWPGVEEVEVTVTWVDGTSSTRSGVAAGRLELRPGD